MLLETTCVPAKWHLIQSNGVSRVHECARRHTYRRTDHATVTGVVIGGIALSVSSVTLVHPAKAVGRNEMSFGRDTCMVPSNNVLDGGLGLPLEGQIWGSEPARL